MSELHFPWLETSILICLIGAFWVGRLRDPFVASHHTLFFNTLTLITTIGAWIDYELLMPFGKDSLEAQDYAHLITSLIGREILAIDPLSAPLLALVALLYFLVTLTTLRTKIRRFSFSWTLVSEAILLATFCCVDPWDITVLLILSTIPPFIELRNRGQNTGAYVKHMMVFVIMLLIGRTFVVMEGGQKQVHSLGALVPLLIAIFIRSGIAPFHCWMGDLFDRATFGTALMFSMPLVGAYATVRLVMPIAPDWVMRTISLWSLISALYASGITLVQTDARRFFCYLFLSYSSLVLVGLEAVTPICLTGALCSWLAVSTSLSGFGLTLRALEARRGRLSLVNFQGLYDHMPALAVLFMITGLASVGFPGTFGFIGTEMLVDGTIDALPFVGVAIIIVSALNGIAVVHAYFRLFTGTHHAPSVSLAIVSRERFAVVLLTALIIIGGLIPQYNVASRHRAAESILRERAEFAAAHNGSAKKSPAAE